MQVANHIGGEDIVIAARFAAITMYNQMRIATRQAAQLFMNMVHIVQNVAQRVHFQEEQVVAEQIKNATRPLVV